MRWVKIAVLLTVALLLLWLFGFGGMSELSRWAAIQQREAQTVLASGLRAVRAGEPGAWAALMGFCAAYGFFHAVGPGHGKLVIGSYGVAARVTAWRLSGLALASSLAQAFVAIILVAIGAFILGWSRTDMVDTAEDILAPVSYAAIALVGIWLAVRGIRRVMSARAHPIDADGRCQSCGHVHAPSVDQAASVTSKRDAFAIIASIAIRPCTSAVFLLILCFGLGIPWAGVFGALFMGMGTASVTILVAVVAVGARHSALAKASGTGAVRAMAMIEVVIGLTIALIATALILPFL